VVFLCWKDNKEIMKNDEDALDAPADNVDAHPPYEEVSESDIKQETNTKNVAALGGTGTFRPDHGSSFVPGAGPEKYAPKSLDHFKRGYEERAAQRDKEFYTVGSTESGEGGAEGEGAGNGASLPNSDMPDGKQGSFSQPNTESSNQQPRGRGGGGGDRGVNTHNDDGYDDYNSHGESRNGSFISSGTRIGRGGYSGSGGGASGGGLYSTNRDFLQGRDYGSNNGTGFGGRGGAGIRGGPGGIGSRRYMDDPWGYRDRPTVLQGLDINALMDRLAELSHSTDKLFAELDRVRGEYKQIFETGKAMTALISVAARRKQIGLGHAVWDWMDLAKLHKNTFHYNSMISVAEKAKNYQQALDLLNEMTDRNIPKNEVT
jgi:pentatricopeptide repeat protein